MENTQKNSDIREIVVENQRLLTEINERLKKQERKQRRDFWLKLVWFFILFIAPLILFYWYLAPMYSSLGGSAGSLDGGLKQLNEINSLLKQ
jgi:cell division septal protein FtsQ